MLSGADPFETKTILFTEWRIQGGSKIIMVLPRKTTGAAYAEKHGGLFLQIVPGTDSLLHMALTRLILENGWEDKEFIEKWIANRWEKVSVSGAHAIHVSKQRAVNARMIDSSEKRNLSGVPRAGQSGRPRTKRPTADGRASRCLLILTGVLSLGATRPS